MQPGSTANSMSSDMEQTRPDTCPCSSMALKVTQLQGTTSRGMTGNTHQTVSEEHYTLRTLNKWHSFQNISNIYSLMLLTIHFSDTTVASLQITFITFYLNVCILTQNKHLLKCFEPKKEIISSQGTKLEDKTRRYIHIEKSVIECQIVAREAPKSKGLYLLAHCS